MLFSQDVTDYMYNGPVAPIPDTGISRTSLLDMNSIMDLISSSLLTIAGPFPSLTNIVTAAGMGSIVGRIFAVDELLYRVDALRAAPGGKCKSFDPTMARIGVGPSKELLLTSEFATVSPCSSDGISH